MDSEGKHVRDCDFRSRKRLPKSRARRWKRAESSSGLSQRKSRRRAPSIARKNITRNICRSAAQRAATSELRSIFPNEKNRAKLLGFFSLRSFMQPAAGSGGEGGILTQSLWPPYNVFSNMHGNRINIDD